MTREVMTYNQIEGYHYYPSAPSQCTYLSHKHRHMFVVRCKFKVAHNEREIEIITMQQHIDSFLHTEFGTPCNFGALSCESIAEKLLRHFRNMRYCEVLEDNYGGAALTR